MKLPPETLRAIRDRERNPNEHHNILLRQRDVANLLGHVEELEIELAAALAEQQRLRRSIP